ncbi:MAG: hypothetical protein OYM47_20165 [Gemmatimonadota bacterium]|nr:hypothetical protein [Gemmatimonadota bacterium]
MQLPFSESPGNHSREQGHGNRDNIRIRARLFATALPGKLQHLLQLTRQPRLKLKGELICTAFIALKSQLKRINLNPKKTATRQRDKTLRNGALSTYRRTFFPFTSCDLMYPGNPQFNRLYLQAHIRINVPEDLRIKVNSALPVFM